MFMAGLRYTVDRMKNILTLFTCLVFGLLFLQPAFSAGVEFVDDSPELGGFTPGEAWKEGELRLPDYPVEDKLIEVGMERNISPFKYYIDPDSLTLGEDDVVRYTVVVKSSSGATNVIYEGLRCSVTEYRTYAFGTSDKKMSKARVSEWKRFYNADSMVHRYNFYHYYMCSKIQSPYSPEEIIQRIRYPSDFNEGSDKSDY